MNNWEKYTLAAVIVTAAGFTYIKSSHRDIPSDLRDAVADNTSAEEFNNLVGVRASEIKPVNDVPMPKTSKTHNCKTGHEKMLREFSITDLVDPDFSETKSAKSSQITAETERDFKKLIQIAGWKNVKRAPIDYVQATNSKNGVSANFILQNTMMIHLSLREHLTGISAKGQMQYYSLQMGKSCHKFKTENNFLKPSR